MVPYAFVNKQFVPLAEAKISVMTHALHYGTACFEGIRANWNAEKKQLYMFRPAEHYERLRQSCHIMRIGLNYSTEEMCKITAKLLELGNCQEDIYIRPLAYKSSLVVGVRLHNLEDDLLIFISPLGNYIDVDKGIKCGISSWRRVDDPMMPVRAKVCGIYVNSALAKTEAIENGYDEAIMLNQNGHVSEGSGENVFMVMGGKLVTPAVYEGVLPGITKATVSKLAFDELGVETVERPISRSELYCADECFLTGTAAHIGPVLEVDRRKIGSGSIGPITSRLQKLYFETIRGNLPKYANWCMPAYTKVKAQA